MYTLFLWFNKDLSFTFKCAKEFCDSELILRQLTDGSVTNYLNIRNIKILNDLIDPNFYPHQSSPELIEYYNLQKNNTHVEFTDINLSGDQLQKLFFNQESKLLEPSNLLDLIYYNSTGDLYSAYNKFLFKSNDQINFVTGYIMDYLVHIFIYDKNFVNQESLKDDIQINSLAHGFTSILEFIINRSYYKLSKDIKLIVISKFIISLDKESINCLKFILPAVGNDSQRASDICKNPLLNMSTYQSMKTWILPHECLQFTDCREKEKKFLLETTNMTLEELTIVYNQENLGKFITKAKNLIKETYKCEDCDSEYLARRQWFESYITMNPPKTYPIIENSTTIYSWDDVEFQGPLELNHYAKESLCEMEDCNESSYEKVFSLYDTFTNSTSFKNRNAFRNRYLIQKAYSAHLQMDNNSTYWYDQINIKNPVPFFNSLKSLISNTMFKNKIINNYSDPSSLLYGNYLEDEYFMKILSSGLFYNSFRPKIKSTTGFNINVDRQHKLDNITVDTGFKENEYYVRRIKNFNGYPIINIYSRVYSPLKKDYIYKNIPLYDTFRIDSSLDFSDGFQFSNDKDFIYFYDIFSSRVLKFKFSRSRSFKENLNCREYTLTNEIELNLHENKIIEDSILKKHPQVGSVYEKFNKPYVITPFNVLKNQTFLKSFHQIKLSGLDQSDERFSPSYICLDPFSDLVLESSITLMYSIHTGKLNNILQDLPENSLIPLFTHTRSYDVDFPSYNNIFPGINDFERSKFTSLIIGLIIVFILMIISIYLCNRYKNAKFVFVGDKKLILE